MIEPCPIPHLEIKTYKSGKHSIKSIEGPIELPAWKGFQSRQGPYNGMDRKEPSNGCFKLSVDGDTTTETPTASKEQVTAYQFLVENQERIKDSILTALLAQYKNWREEYGYEEEEFMPNVTAPSQFQNLVGLSQVHLLECSKDGVAYVGYEFGCNWDDEHGLGVMTHRERVIEIGAADTSFDTWPAENDKDPVQAQKELEKYKDMRGVPPKKPWWKFW